MAKLIFLSHRDKREDEHGYPDKPEEEITCSRCCDFHGPIRSWTASASLLSVRLTRFSLLALWGLGYHSPRAFLLLYDFAPWGRLLIRNDQLSSGIVIHVIVFSLSNRSETKKKAKDKMQVVFCLGRLTF